MHSSARHHEINYPFPQLGTVVSLGFFFFLHSPSQAAFVQGESCKNHSFSSTALKFPHLNFPNIHFRNDKKIPQLRHGYHLGGLGCDSPAASLFILRSTEKPTASMGQGTLSYQG